MCENCGCEETNGKPVIQRPGEKADHHHGHNHHHNDHDHNEKKITVETDILAANRLLAERNRGYFDATGLFAINLMSSPGSGKTTFLERTITDLKGKINFFVVEGDQQTMNDAKRIEATGAPAVQVNTGSGCHLDADMVSKAVKMLDIGKDSVLMIENVGNLICPSLFDLGENKRIVVMSVTEGEDKPLKYPTMFQTADLCIINKTDLLPYLDYDMEKVREYLLQVNHHLKYIEVSAKTGEGMDAWYKWLKKESGR